MKKKDIAFRRVTHLRGPNIWTYRPVIEAWLDIGALEDFPSNTIPGLYERLTAWLPALVEHRCGVGERGGFLERLREGTWAGAHSGTRRAGAAEPGRHAHRLRQDAGNLGTAASTRWPSAPAQEQVGRAALQPARELLMAAIEDRPFDVEAADRRPARHGRQHLPRPEHRAHRRRGHRAPHSVDPPDRRQPGAAGPRRARSAASGPPKPTAPARLPKASPATRT